MRELIFAFLMILTVPAYNGEWPSLGGSLADWMLGELVHGPGDIKGEPLRLDEEQRAFLWQMYQVYPQGHELEGRRLFDRCALSVAKGLAKTELGAIIAAAELSPEAPVRWAGWNPDGSPIGRPVKDPFIPMVAYTEEQSDELAYGALRWILLNSRCADDFDIGLQWITRRIGDGKAVSLASSPGARDGARTTFQLFDETHRFITPELRKAHQTMLANIPKRAAFSDPWTLELTTAYDPSENSIARKTMTYAKAVHEGRSQSTRLFFFHRQADEDCDLTTREGRTAAVLQARGPYGAARSTPAGIEAIVSMWDDPEQDKDYLARVWLNQIKVTSARAFDPKQWANRLRADYVVADGAAITLGFDGSLTKDSTALVATEIQTGFQWLLDLWERPHGEEGETWRVPESEVDAAVTEAFERYSVWRMYCDPYWWETWVTAWAGRYGERVVRWPTTAERKMAAAVRAYTIAMSDPRPDAPEPDPNQPSQLLGHNGDKRFARHIENACKRHIGAASSNGEEKSDDRAYVIQKDRKDSPNKMDAAVAGVLGWQGRMDAIEAGDWKSKGPRPRITVFGGAA